MARQRIGGLLLSGLMLVTPFSRASAQGVDELYESAKLEKALTVYTGAGPAGAKAMAAAFERRFPGIVVTARGDFSNVLDADIDRQLAAKQVTTDVVHLQSLGDFHRWEGTGALLHFKPAGFEQVLSSMKDPDGAWVALNAIPLLYGYNPERVREPDVPRSALDFLKPEFRGKAVSVYPSADDATLFCLHLIVQKYGWDYMARYMANDPYFIVGHRDVAARLRSGQSWVSFDVSSGQAATLRSLLPENDKTPVFFVAGAILKDAPHPNAAKLFLTWSLSRDQQEKEPRRYSPRTDVAPPPGMPPLTSDRFETGYGEFLGDATRIAELRRRFEQYTGPVVNQATE
ncbi:MAG TPA: ABC transporter substrate-binding protein [Caldimonas sp.]|nr:ABC transporter substrate-binding protein [Caldimonas sp.]